MTARPKRSPGELVREVAAGASSREEALRALDPKLVAEVSLSLDLDASAPDRLRGVPAGPGVASGHAALRGEDVLALEQAAVPTILVVLETFPEDIGAMKASSGVVTVHGGLTGHAAVVSRGLGKPCIASGSAFELRGDSIEVRTSPRSVWAAHERFSFDGKTGVIVLGAAPFAGLSDELAEVLAWADASSRARVTARVSTVEDAANARRLGAHALVVDGPDALFFGRERAELAARITGSAEGETEGVEVLVRELRAMGEAFGAPIERASTLRLAQHRALGAAWERACRALGVALDDSRDGVAPAEVPRTRLARALAAIGDGLG